MADDRKLTDKQEAFCIEYATSCNATQAAKAAGYSEKTAHEQGKENLRKPYVIARIKELCAAKEAEREQKILDVVKRREILSQIATDNESTKQDKIKAIDTLNKMDCTYVNKTEISGAVPVVITDDL